MSTVRTNNILDASGGNTATINSMTPTADSLQGFRNRIINGDMRIDQRNAGASVTIGSTGVYTLDRYRFFTGNASKISVQRSTTAPTGFVNSLLVTSLAATSISTTDEYVMFHRIEGTNVSDLGWGTANAKTVTLSFQVRSSLTGTFGGVLRNANNDRHYPFTYSISAANTWEQKTITVAGDTTGTWGTDTGVGLQIIFGLGVGSTYSGTAGAWSSNYYSSATGAVSLVGTNGATWYITGVQLEVGSVATPFERRDYGRELQLCQRYYETSYDSGTAVPTNTQNGAIWFCPTGTRLVYSYPFKVTKRASPTTVFYSPADSATGNYRNDTGATNVSVATGGILGTNFLYMYKTSGATDQTECNVHFSAASEL
jgi:hypothetical protein